MSTYNIRAASEYVKSQPGDTLDLINKYASHVTTNSPMVGVILDASGDTDTLPLFERHSAALRESVAKTAQTLDLILQSATSATSLDPETFKTSLNEAQQAFIAAKTHHREVADHIQRHKSGAAVADPFTLIGIRDVTAANTRKEELYTIYKEMSLAEAKLGPVLNEAVMLVERSSAGFPMLTSDQWTRLERGTFNYIMDPKNAFIPSE